MPQVASAEPLQSVGTLKERARKVAAELEQLDRRTNDLDEDYNTATLELAALRKKLDANRAKVAGARSELAETRSIAQQYAVDAYVGTDDQDSSFGIPETNADDSRRRTYLTALHGNRDEVIEGLVASQKDLADREASLKAANARVDRKIAKLEASKASLERATAERSALYASVSGELKAALKAEQEAMARAATRRAEAEAQAAAQRARAARRSSAVVVRRSTGGGAAATGSVVSIAPENLPSATPPPAGAPTAVRVGLAQQGKPYRWAASGPNSFDCSGLVMYAYAAAGRSLPHSSRSLRSMTQRIGADQLQPGDLVFGGSPVHHVGIYIGNGQMVHAPHSGDVVKVSSMYSTSKPVSFGRL